jgi:transcription elongation factor Elf1
MLHEQQVNCPYCGEVFTAFLDLSQGNYQTIEDCYVCCRPIEFNIESDGQQLQNFDARSDDE